MEDGQGKQSTGSERVTKSRPKERSMFMHETHVCINAPVFGGTSRVEEGSKFKGCTRLGIEILPLRGWRTAQSTGLAAARSLFPK